MTCLKVGNISALASVVGVISCLVTGAHAEATEINFLTTENFKGATGTTYKVSYRKLSEPTSPWYFKIDFANIVNYETLSSNPVSVSFQRYEFGASIGCKDSLPTAFNNLVGTGDKDQNEWCNYLKCVNDGDDFYTPVLLIKWENSKDDDDDSTPAPGKTELESAVINNAPTFNDDYWDGSKVPVLAEDQENVFQHYSFRLLCRAGTTQKGSASLTTVGSLGIATLVALFSLANY